MFSLPSSRPNIQQSSPLSISKSSLHQRSRSTPYLSRTLTSTASAAPPSSYDHDIGDLTLPPPSAVARSSPCEPRKLHKRTLTSTSPTRGKPPFAARFPFAEDLDRSSPTIVPASVFSTTDISFDLSPPHSPPLSPTKEKWSFLSTFKGEKSEDNSRPSSPTKSENSRPSSFRLADWFQGESEPINISILPTQIKEEGEDEYEVQGNQNTRTVAASFSGMEPTVVLQRRSTLSGAQRSRSKSPTKSPATTPSTTSRFAFITNKLSSSVSPSQAPPVPSLRQILPEASADEFATLNIRQALVPQNQAASDPFSPSAFKNLLQNAEGLLSRMQAAYKQRILAAQQAEAEVEAQKEETEEAQTRAQHLKLQLDDLSAKNAEQDAVIMNLVEELAKEKELRREQERETEAAAAARARTVRVVDLTTQPMASSPLSNQQQQQQRTQGQKHARGRVSSASTVSDSGFESNNENEDDSTSTSTTNSPSTPQSIFSSPASTANNNNWTAHKHHTATLPPRIITNTNTTLPASGMNMNTLGSSWGTMDLGGAREENAVLRARIAHLEGELEACLDLVNGLV